MTFLCHLHWSFFIVEAVLQRSTLYLHYHSSSLAAPITKLFFKTLVYLKYSALKFPFQCPLHPTDFRLEKNAKLHKIESSCLAEPCGLLAIRVGIILSVENILVYLPCLLAERNMNFLWCQKEKLENQEENKSADHK